VDDEEDSGDDPDDVFTIPGSWKLLDAPQPHGSATREAEPAGAARKAPGDAGERRVPAAQAEREGPSATARAITQAGAPEPLRAAPAPLPAVPARRRWVAAVVFFGAAVAGGGLTAWLWGSGAAQSDGRTAATHAPAATATPAATAAVPGADVTASAAPPPSAEPAASTEAAPAPAASSTASAAVAGAPAAQSVEACMAPLFPKDTFDARSRPNFAFLCKEADPRKGSQLVRKQVVLGATSGFVSDGMREWALLNWYELAAYAVMRARCCPGSPPIELPETPGACPSIEASLNDMAAAAIKAETPDDRKIEEALERFREGISCLVRSGGTNLFGYVGAPKGGEDTAFRKTLVRLTASR
jgi:serine/threonine-protein kinase